MDRQEVDDEQERVEYVKEVDPKDVARYWIAQSRQVLNGLRKSA